MRILEHILRLGSRTKVRKMMKILVVAGSHLVTTGEYKRAGWTEIRHRPLIKRNCDQLTTLLNLNIFHIKSSLVIKQTWQNTKTMHIRLKKPTLSSLIIS